MAKNVVEVLTWAQQLIIAVVRLYRVHYLTEQKQVGHSPNVGI